MGGLKKAGWTERLKHMSEKWGKRFGIDQEKVYTAMSLNPQSAKDCVELLDSLTWKDAKTLYTVFSGIRRRHASPGDLKKNDHGLPREKETKEALRIYDRYLSLVDKETHLEEELAAIKREKALYEPVVKTMSALSHAIKQVKENLPNKEAGGGGAC